MCYDLKFDKSPVTAMLDKIIEGKEWELLGGHLASRRLLQLSNQG